MFRYRVMALFFRQSHKNTIDKSMNDNDKHINAQLHPSIK